MSTVEAHELYSVSDLVMIDTPWEKIAQHPDFAALPPAKLAEYREEYLKVQASSAEDDSEMLPWFPFMLVRVSHA